MQLKPGCISCDVLVMFLLKNCQAELVEAGINYVRTRFRQAQADISVYSNLSKEVSASRPLIGIHL